MSNFNFGIVTPIWKTDYLYLKETIDSVNSLFRSGITFKWSIVIDGDKRDINDFLRENVDPLLLQVCSIKILDKCCGPSFSRNIGVKILDSEFICWLDGDDTIDIQNFILVFNELNSKGESFWNNYDLVYTDSYDCDSRLKVMSIREKKFIHDLHCKYKNTEFDPLLGVDFVYQMQFIKRDTFLSVGGFNEQLILGEDVDLILRISERSKNINLFHIPIPVYYYRDSPDGRCNSRWEELKYQMERVYLESSKRQNLSFCVYKYIGAFALEENIFRYIKDDGYFSHNSLYDIYLPIDENNKIMPRSYVRMQIDPQ